jgi:hypothetical protein
LAESAVSGRSDELRPSVGGDAPTAARCTRSSVEERPVKDVTVE